MNDKKFKKKQKQLKIIENSMNILEEHSIQLEYRQADLSLFLFILIVFGMGLILIGKIP